MGDGWVGGWMGLGCVGLRLMDGRVFWVLGVLMD